MLLAMVLQTNVSPEQMVQAQKMLAALALIFPIFFLVGAFIRGLPFWFICRKAGFSPWLSLLFLVPMGGIVLSYVVAFADWKVMGAPPPGWTPPTAYPPPTPPPPAPYPPQS